MHLVGETASEGLKATGVRNVVYPKILAVGWRSLGGRGGRACCSARVGVASMVALSNPLNDVLLVAKVTGIAARDYNFGLSFAIKV